MALGDSINWQAGISELQQANQAEVAGIDKLGQITAQTAQQKMQFAQQQQEQLLRGAQSIGQGLMQYNQRQLEAQHWDAQNTRANQELALNQQKFGIEQADADMRQKQFAQNFDINAKKNQAWGEEHALALQQQAGAKAAAVASLANPQGPTKGAPAPEGVDPVAYLNSLNQQKTLALNNDKVIADIKHQKVSEAIAYKGLDIEEGKTEGEVAAKMAGTYVGRVGQLIQNPMSAYNPQPGTAEEKQAETQRTQFKDVSDESSKYVGAQQTQGQIMRILLKDPNAIPAGIDPKTGKANGQWSVPQMEQASQGLGGLSTTSDDYIKVHQLFTINMLANKPSGIARLDNMVINLMRNSSSAGMIDAESAYQQIMGSDEKAKEWINREADLANMPAKFRSQMELSQINQGLSKKAIANKLQSGDFGFIPYTERAEVLHNVYSNRDNVPLSQFSKNNYQDQVNDGLGDAAFTVNPNIDITDNQVKGSLKGNMYIPPPPKLVSKSKLGNSIIDYYNQEMYRTYDMAKTKTNVIGYVNDLSGTAKNGDGQAIRDNMGNTLWTPNRQQTQNDPNNRTFNMANNPRAMPASSGQTSYGPEGYKEEHPLSNTFNKIFPGLIPQPNQTQSTVSNTSTKFNFGGGIPGAEELNKTFPGIVKQ